MTTYPSTTASPPTDQTADRHAVRPGAGAAQQTDPATPVAVVRWELSRRDRLYLARRRLVDAGYDATVRGPVPGSRTVLVLQVSGVATRTDRDRVTRIVRGSDPSCRRL